MEDGGRRPLRPSGGIFKSGVYSPWKIGKWGHYDRVVGTIEWITTNVYSKLRFSFRKLIVLIGFLFGGFYCSVGWVLGSSPSLDHFLRSSFVILDGFFFVDIRFRRCILSSCYSLDLFTK